MRCHAESPVQVAELQSKVDTVMTTREEEESAFKREREALQKKV